MYTRHARKAKSAAADFVKRVIGGRDTSPGPSSKSSKSQTSKSKQSASKSRDVSRSPSRGRSPAATASKASPAAKVKGGKTGAKASPAAKEIASKPSKEPVSTKELAKSTEKASAKAALKSVAKEKEQNQVVPEVILIKSEDEDDEILEKEESSSKKEEEKGSQEKVETKKEVKFKDVEEEQDNDDQSEISELQNTAAVKEKSEEGPTEQEEPVKRKRGRPRKILKGGAAPAKPTVKKPLEIKPKPPKPTPPATPSPTTTSPSSSAPSTSSGTATETIETESSPPALPEKRPRGRPRKYPPGMTPAMYKLKALENKEKVAACPKVPKKKENKYYSNMHPYKLSMGGGIGALTIKIKDDYMLQEGGMVSPRHPTIMCEQDEFFKIFGLIKKSELDEMNRRTHTHHRAAGGKLRRLIKPKISPEMVYRNFMLNKSAALGMVPDEWDSSDEYDDASPMAKLVKSHSAPTTPDHRTLLGSSGKVSLLPKDKGLLKSLKGGHWSSPDEGTSAKKQWLKPPPKTPKRSSIEDTLEAAKMIQKDLSTTPKHKKLDKPVLKKQKSDPCSKSKVVKLELKSKSLEPVKSKNTANSSYRFKPTGGYRPLAPPPKIEEEDPDSQPSRRSARNRGGQRKQWWHLLRANPDEYIPDHKWEEEEAEKEKKKQDRDKRRGEDGEELEEEFEEIKEEEEENKPEEGEVVEKPKKKRKKKVKELLTDEEIAILEAEERAMEENMKKEEKGHIRSPVKSALKRKLDADGSDEVPSKFAKTDGNLDGTPSSPSIIAKKKKKKKKKKGKEIGKFYYMARVDRRGSVLSIHRGSKSKEYMIFDSDFNLVSVHDDSNMYQLTANAVVQLVKEEGWGNLGQEVLEIVLPNRLVKEKLRSQICERMAPVAMNMQEEKERSCITPHMCQVCWVNDHMYCANMKRTGRHLLQGSCLHYTLCSHYRNLSPKETYARYATVSQFGNGGITKNFSISRLNNRDFSKNTKMLSEGTSITISGGKLLAAAQGTKDKSKSCNTVTITVNNAASKSPVQDKNPPKQAEDLVCHEELGESDNEQPSTPGGGQGSKADLLTKHLWVRARQIAQSLGFKDVKEAMESLKKSAAEKSSESDENGESSSEKEVIDVSDDDCIPVQDYVEVELDEYSDSDSESEEEDSRKKYGVPLSTKVQTCQVSSMESVIKIHLMPILEHSRSKFYIKSKDRKVMKVKFSGLEHYREEDQEWKVENDTYTITDVTRKYHKRMMKVARGNMEKISPTAKLFDSHPLQDKVGSSGMKSATQIMQEKAAMSAKSTSTTSPRVIWSSELDLEGGSPKSPKKASPEQAAKKQRLSTGESANTPKRKSDDFGNDSFKSPDADQKAKLDRSADSSPCLSQGSAASHTSTSSAQGQQLLNASPVKLPKPSTSLPAELQNHVSAGKDGSQTLTFTTKDIRQCKPELVQYIKNANLMDMIQKTLTEERNSIEKLLKDGDGDVSRLRDNLEQNECLLLAVKSEAKEVKIKLVDFEMNVITEQHKASRLERRKTKLTNLYDSAQKKMIAFKKAIDRIDSLMEEGTDSNDIEPSSSSAENVGYTLLQLAEGSTVSTEEGMNVVNVTGGATGSGILTAASAAAQLPGTVAMETIVMPPVSIMNL